MNRPTDNIEATHEPFSQVVNTDESWVKCAHESAWQAGVATHDERPPELETFHKHTDTIVWLWATHLSDKNSKEQQSEVPGVEQEGGA